MAGSPVSLSLVISYIIDWVVIIAIAAIGAAFYKKAPNHRPFSPVDPDISFPYTEHEKVSTATLVVVSLLAPAVITALVALIFTPGFKVSREVPKSLIWRRKLWEWNTAWLGLALGLATTFLATEGIKTLIGRPRPDLLARCDLDPALVQQYALGGYGTQLPQFNILVSWTACRQPDLSRLNDGFQSFPSGHSSFSWSVRIPYLLPFRYPSRNTFGFEDYPPLSTTNFEDERAGDRRSGLDADVPVRKQAAAPPAYLFVLPLVPIAAAIYIAGTRFSDFRHHGFDIIFGALLGSLFSFISFHMYHLPVGRGGGWSWGPRDPSKAWGIGVGSATYAAPTLDNKKHDLESGVFRNSNRNKSDSNEMAEASMVQPQM